MEKKLEVKNLKISFRTNNGKVQAVRNIDFDLYKGETLAIVGESGSGKSVTNRAVMGILAGNGMVESGKIIYDGRDLLKISEEEMVKLRGDKIAMIFQDPLSSLNPIMRIGKQITEAMLLKNKASKRNSKREFNSMLASLKSNMISAIGADEQTTAKINELITTFDNFNISALKLENEYNVDRTKLEELNAYIRKHVDEVYQNHTFVPVKVEVNEMDWSIEICMVTTTPIEADKFRYKLDLNAMAEDIADD